MLLKKLAILRTFTDEATKSCESDDSDHKEAHESDDELTIDTEGDAVSATIGESTLEEEVKQMRSDLRCV